MSDHSSRLSSGIGGLDEVLLGGFIPQRAYLVRGGPGSGKTTLCLHFLACGEFVCEKGLFISLGEPESQIRRNSANIGLNLDHVSFLDLSPTSQFFAQVETYDIFSPAEVEREPTTERLIEAVRKINPRRVVIDSMTQFRYLAADPFQYRKQVLSFLRFLIEGDATVLFISEGSEEAPDEDLQFLSDGVISLDNTGTGRNLEVSKFRGSDFSEGLHSVRLGARGLEVFPRLVPETHRRDFVLETISSGIPELDELLHGGVERGTTTIISGPTGVGKTTLGLQFMKEAAGRGEPSVVFTFEENPQIVLQRCESINIPARTMIERGTLTLVDIEPLKFTVDEFASLVRREVEEKGAMILMIDSLAGYGLSQRRGDFLRDIHSLCRYLTNMGVTTFLITETTTLSGALHATESGISYLADNLIFLRYMELQRRSTGVVEMRKSIGVLKKRLTDFDKTLREVEITRYGLKVHQPMGRLSTIFGELPVWTEGGGDD